MVGRLELAAYETEIGEDSAGTQGNRKRRRVDRGWGGPPGGAGVWLGVLGVGVAWGGGGMYSVWPKSGVARLP